MRQGAPELSQVSAEAGYTPTVPKEMRQAPDPCLIVGDTEAAAEGWACAPRRGGSQVWCFLCCLVPAGNRLPVVISH